MIKSNLDFCIKDLMETVSMFPSGEALLIEHNFTENGNKFVNTVTVNGSTYAYGNLVKEFKDEIEKKRYVKRYAKLSIYKALVKVLEIELPWGALTGIRPTKLAYVEQKEGRDFRELFIDTMKVTEKKTAIVSEILDAQKGIYCEDDKNCDFFVFVPFCPSRCEYCSFITADIESAKDKVSDYVSALLDEIEKSSKLIKNLRSIYVGGGTPVSLPVKELERVLKALDKINTGVEFTVEAGRPDVINKEILSLLKKYRVTRICINPQTFKDETLKLIGRNHTAQDIIEKYNMAKDDFSINMDLIAGLPSESFEDFKESLEKAIDLSPDGITVHTLSVKRGSRLWENTKRVTVNDIDKMIDYAHERLKEKGYTPYYLYRQKYMAGNLENTGYTKCGKACVYNIDTMEEISQNIACGAGAVSKAVNFKEDKIERYGNPKDVITYISKIAEINSEKEKLFR